MLKFFYLLSRDSLLPLMLTVSMIGGLFLVQGQAGFSLHDEGFLWYGAQRVLLGEIPIRDFMAYDPGRYYWSAAIMRLWGDNGIMTLRVAVALFQALGLFVGLLLIARSTKKQNFLYLLLSAVTMVIWMFPRHKLFDISLSILLIGVLAYLIANPTRRRYFFAGLCIGLAAIFGRNHGVYAVIASLGIMAWLRIRPAENSHLIQDFAAWAAGVSVGFTPIAFMVLLAPGFGNAFWESIRFLFEVKATNLPLPIAWPWRVDFASLPPGEAFREILVGLFFIAIIVFGLASISWVIWRKFQQKPVDPVLVAASFLTLPYAQLVFSRADVSHLAQGIFPLLVGSLVLLAAQPAKMKWPLAVILAGTSIWVMHNLHPGWQCLTGKQCVSIEVSGSNLMVDPGTANEVALLRKLAGQYAPGSQSFIATPLWPGAYSLLERKAPIWEIYALFPRSHDFEQSEIERIKAATPGFALVFNLPIDGRDELHYRNTHPLTYKYIQDHFEQLPDSPNSAYKIYKAKEGVE